MCTAQVRIAAEANMRHDTNSKPEASACRKPEKQLAGNKSSSLQGTRGIDL
jgi:hypothetical protein